MQAFSINCSKLFPFLINRYSFLKACSDIDQVTDKHIPDGGISIVFNYSGKVRITYNGNCYVLPPVIIAVPATCSIDITLNPPLDTLVVHCKASTFTRFFRHPLDGLNETPFIEADWLIPRSLWTMMSSQTPKSRINSLENYLKSRYEPNYIPDDIDRIYEEIMLSKGEKQVNQLLENLDLNPRSMRRQFHSRTGINAKTLSRIVRVNYLWDCYLKGNEIDFQNMVYDGNYHDQAHLIKDFKKLAGESPSRFFRQENDNSAIFSGKSIKYS